MSSREPVPLSRVRQRRIRERSIVDAARALFDERGLQDAPMDEIAKVVGVHRAQIYRHFESKEELFVLTVTGYLDEITNLATAQVDPAQAPEDQLRAAWGVFATYCLDHPAFLDCALSLMRRPAPDLRERVSDSTWFRLGQSMSACLAVTTAILQRGMDAGVFAIEDPAFVTNCLYTQTLGIMHMARIGVGVSQSAPGVPNIFPVSDKQVHEACIQSALAAVGISTPGNEHPRPQERRRPPRTGRRAAQSLSK